VLLSKTQDSSNLKKNILILYKIRTKQFNILRNSSEQISIMNLLLFEPNGKNTFCRKHEKNNKFSAIRSTCTNSYILTSIELLEF
jgi:hypothetical protein